MGSHRPADRRPRARDRLVALLLRRADRREHRGARPRAGARDAAQRHDRHPQPRRHARGRRPAARRPRARERARAARGTRRCRARGARRLRHPGCHDRGRPRPRPRPRRRCAASGPGTGGRPRTGCSRSRSVAGSASTSTPTRGSTATRRSSSSPVSCGTGTCPPPPATACGSARSSRDELDSVIAEVLAQRRRHRLAADHEPLPAGLATTRSRRPAVSPRCAGSSMPACASGAGADNVRDPFNPVGRSDALETASLLVTAGHLSLAEAVAAVTDGARSVMSLPRAGVSAGARADLLAVRGSEPVGCRRQRSRRPVRHPRRPPRLAQRDRARDRTTRPRPHPDPRNEVSTCRTRPPDRTETLLDFRMSR